jgi:cell division protein ZapE
LARGRLMRTGGVTGALEALVSGGSLRADPAQHEAARALDRVREGLEALEDGSGLKALFRRRRKVPKGLYLWGEVGRGKTLLMDLFFSEVGVAAKRRVHFHEFMDEVHAGIAEFRARADAGPGARDPIPAVVKPIIREVRLLCFDEFHVNDITDAMLLKRLFERLFSAGVTVVATSNTAPDRLYENGLNRQLFTPFIDLLKAHADVLHLAAEMDYRREKLAGQDVFVFGEGPEAEAKMDALFARLTGEAPAEPGVIMSLGRRLDVPAQAMGVARFGFSDLCEKPLGSRDYLRIARAFHTVLIDGVPQFGRTKADAARRFILLVDALYDRGVKLGARFEVPLDELGRNDRVAFEFARCHSRLMEMRSEDYLCAPTRRETAA